MSKIQVSYSRVSTYKKCPYQYFLRYKEKFETIPTDDPRSALILGHALHTGIEKDAQAAIDEYFEAYPIITDLHIDEAIKLEYLIPKVKAILPEGKHEVKIEDEDFIGYIDLLTSVGARKVFHTDGTINPFSGEVMGYEIVEDNLYDLYDFKYSNNVKNYMDSAQLHLYKYYFEKLNPGKRIRDLYFVFIPKVQIKRKKNETDFEFRQRIISELDAKEIKTVKVDYDPNKVIEFLTDTKHLVEAEEFNKSPTRLCDWCEYQLYCEKGIDYMLLPKNERRPLELSTKKKIWLYGPPFAGKTTLTDKFPNPLILTTDGNINNVTAPYIHIKDIVTVEGRMVKRQFAWDVFKDVIAELEKKQNDFETVTLDLVDDSREMCRLYMYDKLSIQHESDSGYGKGWDIIKTEYLSTMRRFFNLPYKNLIICSHEDVTKTLTKKSGEQITRIGPNIQEAIATKLAGMVDLVARVIVNADDSRMLSFKSDSVIFGGGRLNVKGQEIPLDYDALMEVYDQANAGLVKKTQCEESKKETSKEILKETSLPKCIDGERVFKECRENPDRGLCDYIDPGHHCHKEGGTESCEYLNKEAEAPTEQTTRKRKVREEIDEIPTQEQTVQPNEAPTEEAPVRRRRRRVE